MKIIDKTRHSGLTAKIGGFAVAMLSVLLAAAPAAHADAWYGSCRWNGRVCFEATMGGKNPSNHTQWVGWVKTYTAGTNNVIKLERLGAMGTTSLRVSTRTRSGPRAPCGALSGGFGRDRAYAAQRPTRTANARSLASRCGRNPRAQRRLALRVVVSDARGERVSLGLAARDRVEHGSWPRFRRDLDRHVRAAGARPPLPAAASHPLGERSVPRHDGHVSFVTGSEG